MPVSRTNFRAGDRVRGAAWFDEIAGVVGTVVEAVEVRGDDWAAQDLLVRFDRPVVIFGNVDNLEVATVLRESPQSRYVRNCPSAERRPLKAPQLKSKATWIVVRSRGTNNRTKPCRHASACWHASLQICRASTGGASSLALAKEHATMRTCSFGLWITFSHLS